MTLKRLAAAAREESFISLLEANRGILHKVIGAYAWEREDQQDLSQEIVTQLWRSYARYDQSRPFATWMYQVCLNVAISWKRKQRNLASASIDLAESVAARSGPNLEAVALYQLVDRLDEVSRAIFLLSMEDRSHAEIGQMLGITPGNVAVRLSRIRKQLQMELNPENE